jgi:hypothetical protein
MAALAGAAVVFCDPDNGIVDQPSASRLHKYPLISELRDYAQRQQSVIAYHHHDRSAPAADHARKHLDQLATGVQQTPIGAIIAHRGTCRFFLMTAATAHIQTLTTAVDAFSSKWSAHVELILPATR